MKAISGIPASYGIAIGPAFIFDRVEMVIETYSIDDSAAEWARFEAAQVETRRQLDEAYQVTVEDCGEEAAEIFNAQKLMLDDPELISGVKTAVENDKVNVESALYKTSEAFASQLEAIEDEYLSARALDIRDVSSRCLRNLIGLNDSPAAGLKTPSIIVSNDLTPSDTILLDKELVLGFCTALGGSTSHTAILARGLGTPAVVGAGDQVKQINNGDNLIIDGDSGQIIIDPDQKTMDEQSVRM